MKTLIKKLGILIIIAAVVISFLPTYTATAATSTDLQDGAEYSIDVSLLKPGTGATSKEASVANRYIKQQATIKVENNQPYLYLTLNKQTYWQTLATSLASTAPQAPSVESNYTDIYQNVTDVSTDEANNMKVVKLKFDEVNAIIYSYMHINVAELKYDSWYQADMKMDVSTLQIVTEAPTSSDANSSNEAITTVSSEPQTSTSTEPNINVENPVLSQSSVSDTQTSTSSTSASTAPSTTATPTTSPALTEGTYNLPFEAKHATKDQASTMQKYFNNPALIQIKNGRKFVVMTINDSKTVTSFQTTVDGSLTDVTVLSEDTENNTRTVQFEITDETAELLAHVTYAVNMGNGNVYNGKADFRLLFNTAAATTTTDYPTVTKTTLADGTYTVPFDARHATKEQASSMQKYFNNPVYLQIKDGKKYVAMTINDSKTVTAYQTKIGDTLTDVTVLSEDTDNNTRTVQFEITDETAALLAHVNYAADMGNGSIYNGAADFKVLFDTNYAVKVADSSYPQAAKSALEDGTYRLNFEAKHATEDKASSMQKYFNNPIYLQIKEGKKYVAMTINDSKTVTSFQTTVGDALTNVTVLSEDTANNSRVVQFEITDETAELLAYVTYAADMGNGNIYNGKADFRLLFETETATKVADSEFPVAPKVALADGTYTLPFEAKHASEDKASTMQKYFDNPAYLQIKDGKKYVAMTINDSKTVTLFQTTVAAALTDVTVLATNEAANTRTVKFPITDENAELLAHVGYQVEMKTRSLYVGAADFRLLFDTTKAIKVDDSLFPEDGSLVDPGLPTEPTELTEPTDPLQLVNNHQYTINFKVMKEASDELSMMDDYTEKPATIKVEAGQAYAYLTLKNSHWITSFATEQQGKYVEAEIVSSDLTNDTRVVKYPIANANAKTKAKTHVEIYDMPSVFGKDGYQGIYQVSVQLASDTLIDVTLTAPTEPINPAKPVEPVLPSPSVPTAPLPSDNENEETTPTTYVDPFNLQNNLKYTIDFKVVQANSNELSKMDDYTEKPATIKVENNQPYLYLTLTNSHWIKTFETKQKGKYVAAEVVSTNKAADTRIVKYPIVNGASKTPARTHVLIDDIVGFSYDHTYEVLVALDADSIVDMTGKVITTTPATTAANSASMTSLVAPAVADEASTLNTSTTVTDNNVGGHLLKPAFNGVTNQNASTTTTEKNAKTADTTSLIIYGMIILLIGGYFMRRIRLAKRIKE